MKLFLERNSILTPLEKSKIEERLIMFEQLWEESPTVQKMQAQYYEKGEVQALQRTLVGFVQVKFPDLTELARRQAQLCNELVVLETITRELFAAPDGKTVKEVLESVSGQ